LEDAVIAEERIDAVIAQYEHSIQIADNIMRAPNTRDSLFAQAVERAQTLRKVIIDLKSLKNPVVPGVLETPCLDNPI
jgi:D-tyrosyl-tRNA(Tyr) deacylase